MHDLSLLPTLGCVVLSYMVILFVMLFVGFLLQDRELVGACYKILGFLSGVEVGLLLFELVCVCFSPHERKERQRRQHTQ